MNSCVISGLRVTQKRASVSQIETASRPDPQDWLDELLAADEVSEAYVLQTCIRVELYIVTETSAAGQEILSDINLGVSDDIVVLMEHEESLRHLLRVTAGLESFVTGEDQILGQVQDAFQEAKTRDSIGSILETALLKAIHVGERARSETAINDGPTSIGSAAVTLADRKCDLAESTALVIGAGEMGTHVVQGIATRGIGELLLANRTRTRAEQLASRLETPIRVIEFNDLPWALRNADIVVSATGSQDPIVKPDTLANAGRTVIIDLAQPRDIAPPADKLENVIVHNLDVLESITETAREQRSNAVERVEMIIDNAVTELLDQYKRQRVDGVIAGMYQGAERIKQRELSTALSKLKQHGGLTDEQRDDVEALADTLVAQLLAPPTASLRDAAANDEWTTIETAINLFDPHLDTEIPVSELIGTSSGNPIGAAEAADSRSDD